MENKRTLSAVLAQFALGTILYSLVMAFLTANHLTTRFYPQVLPLYGPFIYGLNCLFLRKERSARAWFLMNGLAVLLVMAGTILLDGMPRFLALVFLAFFCVGITIRGGELAQKGVTLRDTIILTDAGALLLVLFALYANDTGTPAAICLPIAAGCAAAMLSGAVLRMNGSVGPKGWGVLGLCLAVMAVLLLVFLAAASPAGEGLVWLFRGFWSALKWLGRGIERLLLLFAGEPEPMEAEPAAAVAAGMSELEGLEEIPAAFYRMVKIILAALAAVVAVLFYRVLGKARLGGRKVGNAAVVKLQRSRPTLKEELTALYRALREKLRRRLYFLRHRGSAPELYDSLLRRFRRGKLRKAPSETPREFLTRLREAAAEDTAFRSALADLMPALDAALYAREPALAPLPCAGDIRRGSRRLLFTRK